VSPDGDVWLVGTPRYPTQGPELLLRFDGEGWNAIQGPERWYADTSGRYLDFDPDGALFVWAYHTGGVSRVARLDDPGWTTFTQADGLEPMSPEGVHATVVLSVAADGSLWLNGSPFDETCGVARYDGTTTTSYLPGVCTVEDFAIAPDGSVWLRVERAGGHLLYVITPEAVAAAE
jgi:hypothetical protein